MFIIYIILVQTTKKLWYKVLLHALSKDDIEPILKMAEYVLNSKNNPIYNQFKIHSIDSQVDTFFSIINLARSIRSVKLPNCKNFNFNITHKMTMCAFNEFQITDIFFNYCFLKANNLLNPKIIDIEDQLIKNEDFFYTIVNGYSPLIEYVSEHSLLSKPIILEIET